MFSDEGGRGTVAAHLLQNSTSSNTAKFDIIT